MEKVLFQNKQWKVLSDFTIEAKNGFYDITFFMLVKSGTDWVQHLSEKNWVNIDLFIEAMDYVLKNNKHG